MGNRHFTLYLNAADRDLLRRVGDALDAAGVDVRGPSGARSVAAVVRAALRIVDEQMTNGAKDEARNEVNHVRSTGNTNGTRIQ